MFHIPLSEKETEIITRQAKDRFCCGNIRQMNSNNIILVRFAQHRTTTHDCIVYEGYVYFIFISSAFVSILSALRIRDGIVTTLRDG